MDFDIYGGAEGKYGLEKEIFVNTLPNVSDPINFTPKAHSLTLCTVTSAVVFAWTTLINKCLFISLIVILQ